MSFILSADRQLDVIGAFHRYRQYLDRVKPSFPASLFELAASTWYFDPDDHRCPHDSWLEQFTLSESQTTPSNRIVNGRMTLLGAYDDLILEFLYQAILRYDCDILDCSSGHRDWLYDEFRVSDAGNVIHEIEWSGATRVGHWLIEASDVIFRAVPVGEKTNNDGGS